MTTTFIDINITTDNNKLVEINIPNAIGTDLISVNINSEISKVVIAELHVGEADSSTSKSIEESITLFNDEYNDFNTDFPDSTAPWEVQIDGEILFESSEIISIAITSYMNTGGAHGITNISITNQCMFRCFLFLKFVFFQSCQKNMLNFDESKSKPKYKIIPARSAI